MRTLLRLCEIGGPFRFQIALTLCLSVATLLSAVALLAMSGYLISKAAIATDIAVLAIAFTSVRVFAISRACFRYLERLTSHVVTFLILGRIRTWFYTAVEPLAPARFGGHRSGDLLARSVSDLEAIEGFYIRVLVPPLAATVAAVAVCALLGVFDARLALGLAPFLLLTGLVLPILTHRLTCSAARELVAQKAAVHSMLVDEIQGAADLRVFDVAEDHRRKSLGLIDSIANGGLSIAVTRAGATALVAAITTAATIVTLCVAAAMTVTGELDGVYLAMLALVTITAFEAIQPMSGAVEQWATSKAAAERVFEVVDQRPAVKDGANPDIPMRHRVEFREVSFSYEPAGAPVLERFSLVIEEGAFVAITGPSGAGKTTIINLLLRFWDPDAGLVFLGGRDLRAHRAEAVRECLAVVPQDIHLFNASIRDNLLLAAPDATDAELLDACRIALLGEFVGSLPEGLDTPIGENGLSLSGGERQRLAIARMVLKDAPVVVLDEPTANLDPVTEKEVMDALAPLLANRTVLLISHRPPVLAYAGKTLELRDGRLAAVSPVEVSA